MTALRHIKLKAHKGLKEVTLLRLEKINVICGPNNSGKTTVLECVEDRNLSLPGIEISESEAERLALAGLNHVGWGNGNSELSRKYIERVKGAFSCQPVWFPDQSTELLNLINWRLFDGWQNATGNLDRIFEQNFGPLPSVVLIPAKRRLETSKVVNAFEVIQPDGYGVLNFLFAAKNKEESSQERKKFVAITAAFREISARFDFDVFLQERKSPAGPAPTVVTLQFRRKDGVWIHAEDCGMGLQDLLIILYFALASDHEVVLIEEPENHLHPEIQRRLIGFLREKTKKQFFLSTHSSIFLNTQFADRVFTCRLTDSIHVENSTSRAVLLTELGYSIADNLVSDLIVLCEGPKDKLVLDEFFRKKGLLDRFNIKVWPLGGDIMGQLDLSVFQQSHKLIALIDGDPGSSRVRKDFQKRCEALQIPVTRLERYSIENYFSLPAITSVMKEQMPSHVTGLDPKRRISEQLGFEVKNNGGKIAREMTLEEIKDTDFEVFLKQVESMVSK